MMSKFNVGDLVFVDDDDSSFIDVIESCCVSYNCLTHKMCDMYRLQRHEGIWTDEDLELFVSNYNVTNKSNYIPSHTFKVHNEWVKKHSSTNDNITLTIDSVHIDSETLKKCFGTKDELTDREKEEQENKEEKEMNKVVDLWYSRKKENIYKKYKDLEDKYVKEHYEIVKQYNEMIENFEKNLEEFCTKYSDITVNDDFVIYKNTDCNVYKYAIDEEVIRNDARITYKEAKNNEYKELQLQYEDLNALLSMSEDLEYQQSILIEYGIIDKKTKRMITNEDNSK